MNIEISTCHDIYIIMRPTIEDSLTRSQPPPQQLPELLPAEALGQAAECLRAAAHPQRLQLLHLLQNGEYPVGVLAETIGVLSHVASEHLRLLGALRHAGRPS